MEFPRVDQDLRLISCPFPVVDFDFGEVGLISVRVLVVASLVAVVVVYVVDVVVVAVVVVVVVVVVVDIVVAVVAVDRMSIRRRSLVHCLYFHAGNVLSVREV